MGAAQVLLHVLENENAPYKPMAGFNFSLLDLLSSGVDSDTRNRSGFLRRTSWESGRSDRPQPTRSRTRRCRGIIHLIDNEKIDDSNLNRYVLARRRDIGRWKVDVATEALRRTALQVEPYRGAFASYTEVYGGPINLLLSPVDSEEGRRGLAKTLPRRIINAATGGTTVTISTHGFADGKACLHCLYMPELNRASHEEIMAKDMGLPLAIVQKLVETNNPVDAQLAKQIERHRDAKPGTWDDHVCLPLHSFYIKAVCGERNFIYRPLT